MAKDSQKVVVLESGELIRNCKDTYISDATFNADVPLDQVPEEWSEAAADARMEACETVLRAWKNDDREMNETVQACANSNLSRKTVRLFIPYHKISTIVEP